MRYVREASIEVAKPVAARFLPDKTFSSASGGYRIGFYLPNVTEAQPRLTHQFSRAQMPMLLCMCA